jgi:hypothetical protein
MRNHNTEKADEILNSGYYRSNPSLSANILDVFANKNKELILIT